MVFVHSVSRRKFSARNSSSPLLALPGELRNQIYQFVLTDDNPSVFDYELKYSLKVWPNGKISPKHETQGKARHLNHPTIPVTRLALLQTCRQIYGEAYHIYYATHTFEFRYQEDLRLFLKIIGRKRRREIVSLGLDLVDPDHMRKPPFLPLLKQCVKLQSLRLNFGLCNTGARNALATLGELRGLREVEFPSRCAKLRILGPSMGWNSCQGPFCLWCLNDWEKLKMELEDKMTKPRERERLKLLRESSKLKEGETQEIYENHLASDNAVQRVHFF
ncbi:MAG: hypothetical protein M1835_002879 [Candelina submexicana]|nr:MAG: hypothetical protein M1835_002879 [Candelina submexicana]